MNSRYSFIVRGLYPDGNTVKMSGHTEAPDDFTAADRAVAACESLSPGLIVDRSKIGNVTLRKLKGRTTAPKRYLIKKEAAQ